HTRWPRDWSSDVCSSDLDRGRLQTKAIALLPASGRSFYVYVPQQHERHQLRVIAGADRRAIGLRDGKFYALAGLRDARYLIEGEIGRASCRERVERVGGG